MGKTIGDLTAIPAAVIETDILELEDDPGGSPASVKCTVAELRQHLDNEKTVFGTGDDSSIYFDATNLLIDPEVNGVIVSGVATFSATGMDLGGNLTFGTSPTITATTSMVFNAGIVRMGNATAITAGSYTDDLVIENTGPAGISILAPNSSDAKIAFGSPNAAAGASLGWNYDGGFFNLSVAVAGKGIRLHTGAGTLAATINSSQQITAGAAAGYALLNETSLSTNPTLIPDRSELTTGIGGTGNEVSIIGSGNEVITVGNNTLGFYATAPTAQLTGVAVSAAGIHAALVTLGLITA